MCSFSFISKHFIISVVNSSLIYGSFSNVLSKFPYFVLVLIYNSNILPQRINFDFNPFTFIETCFFGLEYALFWRMISKSKNMYHIKVVDSTLQALSLLSVKWFYRLLRVEFWNLQLNFYWSFQMSVFTSPFGALLLNVYTMKLSCVPNALIFLALWNFALTL